MQRRYAELPLAVEIERTQEQLHVLDGLVAAAHDPRAVLDLILSSDDVEVAVATLRERLQLTEIQARAILDTQFRSATRLNRSKMEDQRNELTAQLTYLRGLDAAKSE